MVEQSVRLYLSRAIFWLCVSSTSRCSFETSAVVFLLLFASTYAGRLEVVAVPPPSFASGYVQ